MIRSTSLRSQRASNSCSKRKSPPLLLQLPHSPRRRTKREGGSIYSLQRPIFQLSRVSLLPPPLLVLPPSLLLPLLLPLQLRCALFSRLLAGLLFLLFLRALSHSPTALNWPACI